MLRHLLSGTMIGVYLWTGLLVSPANSHASNRHSGVPAGIAVRTEELNPFTRMAQIPTGADLNTLRFENLRLILVPTRIKYTSDKNCTEFAFGEPGGATGCTHAQVESRSAAYEVTYSYQGQPLASDESAGTYFTLQVYFRPDELDQAVRQVAAAAHENRADIAAYFALSTSQEKVAKTVVDESQSRFCDGNFVDGEWARTEPTCADQISYETISVTSDYITVRLDPTASHRAATGVASPALQVTER